ncbi:MAG: hypothetical protein P5702_20025 [Limnospira sp. PMC 1291.21]|uniref:Uncharacterized protein n=1 Tax=Limnospira fusiformis PMC 851.14 TaxID=2219512 RepID=A0ABU9ELV1_LIMFS|nr:MULTISPECIES: hypothetical protein [Limnospira]EKD06613.1 hypothetical protein SPLC1_S532070 [Arthrospira platensis C1]MDC0837858.1 hypothetical protein [Limnoraphis robusta]MDY7051162.1 hypothetical protein [Limnospira fusiformis LS22]QJB26519.1 hypothetical protein HFV01_12790 [Limnospira fusiformis SAG 85.79]MDT9179929.1 hypothetical protein [Limnospira sp. PMC 1238.20]
MSIVECSQFSGGSIHNTTALSPSDPLLGPDLLRFITTDHPVAIANIAFSTA